METTELLALLAAIFNGGIWPFILIFLGWFGIAP